MSDVPLSRQHLIDSYPNLDDVPVEVWSALVEEELAKYVEPEEADCGA